MENNTFLPTELREELFKQIPAWCRVTHFDKGCGWEGKTGDLVVTTGGDILHCPKCLKAPPIILQYDSPEFLIYDKALQIEKELLLIKDGLSALENK